MLGGYSNERRQKGLRTFPNYPQSIIPPEKYWVTDWTTEIPRPQGTRPWGAEGLAMILC